VAIERVLPLIGVLAFASGCVNLQAVNTASGQLVSAASSWNAVADDFEASCHRRNQVSDVPSDCAAEKQSTASLEAADKILSAYFTALQQVSNGSNFSVDPGMSALETSVQSIPGAKADQVQAVSAFAKFLADAATLALRERTLKTLISNGVPKADATIDVLNNVVVHQLSNVLDREDNQTLTTFTSYILQSGVTADLRNVTCADGPVTHSFSTGNAFLLAEAYCSRMLIVSQKRAALVSYQSSLVTAKKTLQDLQDGKDNLAATAIIQQLVSQASSLKNDVDKIQKAF
jgi:hypothetical protein